MSETKHTPGPWTIGPNATKTAWIITSPHRFIAAVGDYPRDPVSKQNAKLIAAAPEMLDVLKDLHTEFVGLAAYLETCASDVIWENLPTTIAHLKQKQELIEAAIRKAKGE